MNPEKKPEPIKVEPTFEAPQRTANGVPAGDPKPDMNKKMKKPKVSDFK